MDQKNYEKAVALRHELHAHPELSEQEVWTKARLIEFLRENTSVEIVDKGKWFYAVYRGGGDRPGIGFRTEMDALPMCDRIDKPYVSTIPGCGHKCGHDGHAATMCGLALELERLKPKRDVYMLFQHAEENGAGAKECGDFVPETGIEEIYAYHNNSGWPDRTVVLFRTNYACASMGMNIAMSGSPAHASMPENGRNPADALCRIVCEIPRIADQKRFDNLVLATIVEVNIGTHSFGISAYQGTVGVTLRALVDADLHQMRTEIEGLARYLAEEGGFEVEFSYEDVFPDTICTENESLKVCKAAELCGYPVFWSPEPNRGSEDYGWFLKQVKGSIFEFSCGENRPEFHTEDFDFDDTLIPDAIRMYLTLIDL